MPNKPDVKDVYVSEIMSAPVKAMHLYMSIRQAIAFLITHRISGAPLIDNGGKIVSVVSEMDLMKLGVMEGLAAPLSALVIKLPESKSLITIAPEAPFKDLFKLFLTNGVRRVIVLDPAGKPVGIVTRRDIIKSYLDHHD